MIEINERLIQQKFFHEFQDRIVVPNITPLHWFECDILAVTKAKIAYEYEIKVSMSDFRADFKKGYYQVDYGKNTLRYSLSDFDNKKKPDFVETILKHDSLAKKLDICPNYFSFIVTDDIVADVEKELPVNYGLMVARYRKSSRVYGRSENSKPYLVLERVVSPNKLHGKKNIGESVNFEDLGKTFYYRMWNAKKDALKVASNE